MEKLCADMPSLLLAWEDESPDNLYYLDTRTGVVKLVHQHLFELRDLTDEIEKNRERFLYIPKPDRAEMRKDLRNYMGKVKTGSLLPILEMAFESPHSYMAFRKILEKDSAELSSFLDDRDQLIRSRIDEWLSANGYVHDASYVNPLDDLSEDDEENDEADDYYDDGDEDEDSEKDANDFSPGRRGR
jgi:hypothetical protein